MFVTKKYCQVIFSIKIFNIFGKSLHLYRKCIWFSYCLFYIIMRRNCVIESIYRIKLIKSIVWELILHIILQPVAGRFPEIHFPNGRFLEILGRVMINVGRDFREDDLSEKRPSVIKCWYHRWDQKSASTTNILIVTLIVTLITRLSKRLNDD